MAFLSFLDVLPKDSRVFLTLSNSSVQHDVHESQSDNVGTKPQNKDPIPNSHA